MNKEMWAGLFPPLNSTQLLNLRNCLSKMSKLSIGVTRS